MLIQALVGYVLVSVLVQAPVLWLASRMVVGSDRARFMDAVWISLSAIVANALIGFFLGRSIADLAQLVVYLGLIGKYNEIDWLKAGVIAVVNMVLGWVILWVLITFIGVDMVF